MIVLATLFAGANAFTPTATFSRGSVVVNSEPTLGAGGMADTRDPEEYQDEDPRKSISAAPSFEEYMKSRQQGN